MKCLTTVRNSGKKLNFTMGVLLNVFVLGFTSRESNRTVRAPVRSGRKASSRRGVSGSA